MPDTAEGKESSTGHGNQEPALDAYTTGTRTEPILRRNAQRTPIPQHSVRRSALGSRNRLGSASPHLRHACVLLPLGLWRKGRARIRSCGSGGTLVTWPRLLSADAGVFEAGPGGRDAAVTAAGARTPAAPPRPPVCGPPRTDMAAPGGRCGSGEGAGLQRRRRADRRPASPTCGGGPRIFPFLKSRADLSASR